MIYTINSITVNYGKTIPTAPFANTRIDVPMTATVDGEADEALCARQMLYECKALVDEREARDES